MEIKVNASNNTSGQTNNNSQRWWEYYLMRYLIGTILGLFIVSYIIIKNPILSSALGIEGSLNWLKLLQGNYWSFLALGFAYCYLSSAPVLVFHACRHSFVRTDKRNSKLNRIGRFIRKHFILIFITIITGSIIFFFFCDIEKKTIHYFSRIMFIVIVALQLFLIVFSSYKNRVEDFYSELSKKRSIKLESDSEFIQSYKHLREHGNAFLILLTEFSLGFILVNTTSVNQFITVLTLWVLPAALVWFIATQLEFSLLK